MSQTAWQMDMSDLGAEATQDDLYRFRAACARYLHRHSCSEEEATDAVWGEGDCWGRVMDLTLGWPQ